MSTRPIDQCSRNNLGMINTNIGSIYVEVDGKEFEIPSLGMVCLNPKEVVKITSEGSFCVILAYTFIRTLWYRYMSKGDSLVATSRMRHIPRYYIDRLSTACWLAGLTGVPAGGSIDGPMSHIDIINTRMLRYKNDTQLSMDYRGPNEFSTITHDTDIPFTITIFQGLTSIITVTGRSSEHSFIASYLVDLNMTTGYTYEMISSYTTPDLILYPQVHEMNTFSIETSVSTVWKIHVTIS